MGHGEICDHEFALDKADVFGRHGGLAVAGWAGVDTSQGMGMTLACIGGAVAAFAAIKLTAR